MLNGFHTSLLTFLPVNLADIPEIYHLRSTRRNNFLKPIGGALEEQYDYFERYNERYIKGLEVYLKVIVRDSGLTCGFLRITKLSDSLSLGWESLIVKEGTPAHIGIEICMSVYFLAFDHLKRSVLGPWIVTRENLHMMKIHNRMGFTTCVDETSEAFVLIVERRVYESVKLKMIKMGFARGFKEN